MKKITKNELYEAKDKSNIYYVISPSNVQVFDILDETNGYNIDWDSFKLSDPIDGRLNLNINGKKEKVSEFIKNNTCPYVYKIK